ncbi:AraC family transcriptional regulator [Enterococcus durans]|uniref:AraC family transcriptional regulator n=1 Tax=Enterococcus durans TaxID=53345 RepID=UPI001F0DB32A|nr:AraC family transcriptional regulator [Enterococcus durans]
MAFTNETTCSIAEKLGYPNPSVLYKKFKRETGQTMSEYLTPHNAEFHAEKSSRTMQ